jgi:hypothetical protein
VERREEGPNRVEGQARRAYMLISEGPVSFGGESRDRIGQLSDEGIKSQKVA